MFAPLQRLELATLLCGLLCGLLPLAPALADTRCTLATSGLAFAAYDVANPQAHEGLGQVQITCSRDGGPQHLSLSLDLSAGQSSGSAQQRAMRHQGSSADLLIYQLYQDAVHTSVWGSGVQALSTQVSVPNKQSMSVSLPLYGLIPAGQDVHAGLYTDQLTLTLTP